MIARFLAWLRKWVIPESSSVVRTTSPRGRAPMCPVCLRSHHPRCLSRSEVAAIRARLSGSYSLSAGTARPPTVATTAPSTTPGIGGSPGPDSAVPDSAIHHNPHSGRRGQFGMCDYP